MNSQPRFAPRERGLTLIEMMITMTVVAITGSIVFYILNTGMILFAKNTAINMAHQQARIAVLQMEQDMHAAVSIPQLVDASKNPVAGNGPAAGISFQSYAKGPLQVAARAAAGQSQISDAGLFSGNQQFHRKHGSQSYLWNRLHRGQFQGSSR